MLSLDHNQLTVPPASLRQLSRSRDLYLSDNRLTALPEFISELSQLRLLTARNNNLSTLPKSLLQLRSLEQLYLHGNSGLGLPTEILGAGLEAVVSLRARPARPNDILTYYFENQHAARPLNEVKLILVGRGQAGKSPGPAAVR